MTTTPAPPPRPPAAVADMARNLATDYAAKGDNIVADGAYGARLVDELVGVLAGLAEELDRYQEAAVDPAVALLTPCQPPDAADAICHPGESWPCSRTHAAWALRSWDADAQVEAAVRRWRFREGAGDAARLGRDCDGGTDCCPPTDDELFLRGTMTAREWHAYLVGPTTADRSPELAAGVLAGIHAAELHRALTDLARRMGNRADDGDNPSDCLAMSDYADEIRALVAKATPAEPAAGDDPTRTIARAAARSVVEYVEDEGWFPHDSKTPVPDACADAVVAALTTARRLTGQETPECPKCGRLHHPWCQPYGGPGYIQTAIAATDQPGEDLTTAGPPHPTAAARAQAAAEQLPTVGRWPG